MSNHIGLLADRNSEAIGQGVIHVSPLIWGFTLFIGVATILLVYSSYPVSNLLILACLFAMIFGVVLATYGNTLGFAHPVIIFAIGFTQYYLLGPITQVLFGDNIHLETQVFGQLSPKDDSVLAYTIWASLLGLVSFFVGYFSNAWKLFGHWKIFHIGRRWSERSAVLVAVASLGIFIVGVGIFFAVVGFFTYLDTPRSLRYFLYAQAPGAGFLIDFSGTALILLSVVVMERYRGDASKALAIISMLFLPYALFHQTVFSGSRIQIVRVVAILLIYWHLRIHTIAGRRLVLWGLGLTLLIVALGFARAGLGVEDFELLEEVQRNIDSWDALLTVLIYAMDFPTTYDIFLMMTNHLPDFDPGYGVTYAKLFLSVIPRDFWPDKPENITWVATQIFRPELQELGVSYNPSILGEMYYNFGMAGIIVGCPLFGIACRLLYYYLRNNIHHAAAVVIYSALLFSVLEQFRGAFSNITTHYIAFYVLPVIGVSMLAGRRATERTELRAEYKK
jgi:oligosaccharide repeat unit polymerase